MTATDRIKEIADYLRIMAKWERKRDLADDASFLDDLAFRRGKNGRLIYPWPDLKVGDTWFAPATLSGAPAAAAKSYSKYHGIKISARKGEQNGAMGYWFTRVK